jgi:hypothetical protein
MKKAFKLSPIIDEEFGAVLTKMISGMLPHEKYEPALFGRILKEVFDIIPLWEMNMQYYVIFHILEKLRKIQIVAGGSYIPKLTREMLDETMDSEAINYVSNSAVGMSDWIKRSLSETSTFSEVDLKEEIQLQESTSRLYNMVMDLYDDAWDLQIDSNEALGYGQLLESNLVRTVAWSSLDIQGQILNSKYVVQGKEYVGPIGWNKYNFQVNRALRKRLDRNKKQTIRLEDIEDIKEMDEKLSQSYIPLASYGYAPLDSSATMFRHWLAVVVGTEGTGKTAMFCDSTTQLLLNGRRVCYIMGETTEDRIYSRILSNLVYKREGLRIPSNSIASTEELDAEEINAINRCKMFLISAREEGRLILHPRINYNSIYEDLFDLYEETNCDAFFIDHSLAQDGLSEVYQAVEKLSIGCRNFKNDYPVFIGVSSHPSVEAVEYLERGKVPPSGPTKGNKVLSQEADFVSILYTNDELKAQEKIKVIGFKTRGNKFSISKFFLRFDSRISVYEYNKLDQGKNALSEEEAANVISMLRDQTDSEEDEYESTLEEI